MCPLNRKLLLKSEVRARIADLLDDGSLERVILGNKDYVRLVAPFSVTFAPHIIERLIVEIPDEEETGGVFGATLKKRDSLGWTWVEVDQLELVRNTSNEPEGEYIPDDRSWLSALKRMVAGSSFRLPLTFHSHPTGDERLLDRVLHHDVNFRISDADIDSSLEAVDAGGIPLLVPQLLAVRRTLPYDGLFVGIYGSELAQEDLDKMYRSLATKASLEAGKDVVDAVSALWESDKGKAVGGVLLAATAFGLVVNPGVTLGLVLGGGAVLTMGRAQASTFEEIDNRPDNHYFAFTSRRGEGAVLAFHVPYHSARGIEQVEPVVHKLRAKLRT